MDLSLPLFVLAVVATPQAAPVDEARSLAAAVDAIPAVHAWPLRDRLVALMVEHERPLPKDGAIYPLAEIYRGDRAAVLLTVADEGELARAVSIVAFRRKGAGWEREEGFRDHEGWGPIAGHRALLTLEIGLEGRTERRRWVATREGAGWVLLEPFGRPARQTIGNMRTMAANLEVYAADHGGAYPARLDELVYLNPPRAS